MPGLSRTHKAVLNQVCGLAENGQRKQCDATNPYLATRLRPASERTISRTLADLHTRGLLLIEGQGKARRMWPVEALRACYLTAVEAEQEQAIRVLSALANLDRNLDKTGPNLDTNLDKMGAEPSQNGEVEPDQPRQNGYPNLDTFGHQPRQNGSRVYRDEQYEQLKVEVEALRSAAAADQKKIEQLEYDNRQLRASVLAQRPGGATASAAHTGGARRISFVESEFATDAGFRTLAASMNCAKACAAYYLPDMRVKAAGLDTRDAAGWRLWVHSWLKRERDSAGVVEKMPTGKPGPKAGQVDKRRSAIEEAMAMDDAEND